MNRALVAALLVLVLMWLWSQRQPERRRPVCHHIYGCTRPDWGY